MVRLFALVTALTLGAHVSARELAPIPEEIPYGLKWDPKEEKEVFAVASKQGSRVLMSRDDGRTWKQVFLATDHKEDGGYHGNFAVYGMAMTEGMIGVFSGWGAPGIYLGSDDGKRWGHLNQKGEAVQSIWDATGGNGVLLTSADQWRGISTAEADDSDWTQHSVKELLDGEKTHHMICTYGDYEGGRFVVVGDNRHVFIGDKDGKNWRHSRIPEEAGEKQDGVEFGNGVFVCRFPEKVAVSKDGGETWTVHPNGLEGQRPSWRGFSFVRGEFWSTSGKRKVSSKDGVVWNELPQGMPSGRFVEGAGGTLINVDRSKVIRRSEDGKTWETVFTGPETEGRDATWSFAFAVAGKMKAE